MADTPNGSTNWHPHDQGIDVYSVVPHHGGGEHPVAPVSTHPTGGSQKPTGSVISPNGGTPEPSFGRDYATPGTSAAKDISSLGGANAPITSHSSMGQGEGHFHAKYPGNNFTSEPTEQFGDFQTRVKTTIASDYADAHPGQASAPGPAMAGRIPADPFSNPEKFSQPSSYSNRLVYTGGGTDPSANMAKPGKPTPPR